MSYNVLDGYGQVVARWELRGDGIYELRDTFGRPTETYNPGTREYVDAKGVRSMRVNEPWSRSVDVKRATVAGRSDRAQRC